jgi:hypothetical protein
MIDQKLVKAFQEALAEAEKQNRATDAALRGLHGAAKSIVDACKAEAKERNINLDD